ncbi:Tm-1-like ATP-binding domain-containing protein [Paenibacillus frigoriresistens]|uniref:Tm-1-like ATP-binding domain-containing protein n=1 Tax=Paenibacillus alginolyticus TaxID=59839 RepID=UPI0015645F62|nr:Tm-1-like ATP-binding domain-containing protein [Paenibacillus frigoriresistens]NRF96134.1 Tm-1-like ATP-binding domain-containing protein [Paenibacillus frigoriresistens]
MSKVIGLIGALDTKGVEFEFLSKEIDRHGHKFLIIDTGVIGDPYLKPSISNEEVASAGGTSLKDLTNRNDRGEAMAVMAAGAAKVVRELYKRGAIQGIIGMGGTAGTSVSSNAMRTLPIGFPKMIISTVAAGNTRGYLGAKDIVLYPAVVDVAGINRISRIVFTRAAAAICGMVESEDAAVINKPVIAATMFGNTTQCVERARTQLEQEQYEVLVFHCTGTGGQTMESLVADEYIDAVLDITTTEWADEIAGGVFAAGSDRGDAAANRGIPQVIVPGCVDMVNFWARSTVPPQYSHRNLYEWNPNITLMRTTPEENARIGQILAEKANTSKGPVAFLLPLQGVSILDSPGQPFWHPEANQSCFNAIKANLKAGIPIYEMDCNINDAVFAERAVELLLQMLQDKSNMGRTDHA